MKKLQSLTILKILLVVALASGWAQDKDKSDDKKKKEKIKGYSELITVEALTDSAGALDKLNKNPCGTCLQAVLIRRNQQDKVELMTTHLNTEPRKKLRHYDIPDHAHALTFPVLWFFENPKIASVGRLS